MILSIIKMIQNLKSKIVSILLCIVIAFSAYQLGSHIGYNNGYEIKSQESEQQLTNMKLEGIKNLDDLRKDKQKEVNTIKEEYDEKLRDIKKDTDSTIANLNNANVRLRIQIKRSSDTTGFSQCTTPGQSNDYAELSEGSSRFLIGQAIKADDWIKSLQQLVLELNKELQQEKNKK